jgi:hypothetical protein
MRVIEATFRRRPIIGREPASAGRERPEGARCSFVTWGSFATFVVGCTIVGTALFLGTRIGGSP